MQEPHRIIIMLNFRTMHYVNLQMHIPAVYAAKPYAYRYTSRENNNDCQEHKRHNECTLGIED